MHIETPPPTLGHGEASMLAENYGPADWTNNEIEGVKAVWDEQYTIRSWQRLQWEESGDRWRYLKDPWPSFSVLKRYA